MKKKLLSALLSVAMVSTMLVGCGSTATTETESAPAAEETATTEAAATDEATTDAAATTASSEVTYKGDIEIMHYSTAEEENSKNGGATAFRYAIGEWEAAHPDITLTQNVLSNNDYKDKIATLAASDSLPDVFMLQGMNTANWADQGLILDLTDAIKNSPYYDKYTQSYFYAFTADDKQYAVPALTAGTCCQVLYNKEIFKAAGFDEFPETWAELIAAQDKIKAQGVDYVMGFANGDAWQANSCFLSTLGDRFTGADWTYSLIENTGSKFTDEAFVNALTATKDIFASGLFNPDFNSASQQTGNDYYVSGQAASVICGNWDATYVYTNADPELIAKTGIAVLPQPDGATASQKTHDIGMGYGLAINPKVAEDPEKLAACLDLIYEITGPTFADYVAENFALTGLTQTADVDLSAFDQFTQDCYTFNENPGCEIYDSYIDSAVIGVLNQDVQAMLSGQMTPEEVAEETQAEYDSVYEN